MIISSINKGKQMKARLAKKLANTPIDRLAPYWFNNIRYADRCDARFDMASTKYNKRNNNPIKTKKQ